MRVLFLPEIYTRNILNCSCVNNMLAMARGCQVIGADVEAFIALPSPGPVYAYEMPANEPGLTFLPYTSFSELVPWNEAGDRLFTPLDPWPESIDVIASAKLLSIPLLRDQYPDVTIVSWVTDLVGSVFNPGNAWSTPALISPYVQIPHVVEQGKLRWYMMQSLHPKLVNEIDWFVGTFSVDLRRLPPEPVYPNRKKPRMFFGGSSTREITVPAVIQLARQLYEANAIEKLVVSAIDDRGMYPDEPWIELYNEVIQSHFFELIHEGDFFVFFGADDAGRLSHIEQVISGQVGIFMDFPWFQRYWPESYPFIVQNEEEMVRLAFWVAKNINQAREAVRPAIDELKVRHGNTEMAKRWVKWIQDIR